MSTLFEATPFKGTSINTVDSVSSQVKSFTRIGMVEERSHYYSVSKFRSEKMLKTQRLFIILKGMQTFTRIIRHLEFQTELTTRCCHSNVIEIIDILPYYRKLTLHFINAT